MRDALKRWLGGGRDSAPAGDPAAGLRERLASYPANGLPHPGWGRRLSLAQAEANREHFLAALPARLQALAALLRAEAGIDIEPALAEPVARGPALADQVATWAQRSWPALLGGRVIPNAEWLASTRSGNDMALSLVADVGLLFGELIRRGNGDWRWDVDTDAGRLKKDMASAHRVVLLAEPVGSHKSRFVLDPEDVVALVFCRPDSVQAQPGTVHPWRQLVEQGLSGGPMAFWRANP